MGYTDLLEAVSGAGAAGAPGITAAARLAVETETWLVASSAGGSITVADGDVMALDVTSLAASVRSRVARRMASAATEVPVGVAMLDASVVIPQTTAAGDIMVPIKVMRRGFHNAVNVLGAAGAAGNVVCTGASGTVGRAPSPIANTAVTQALGGFTGLIGVALGAASAGHQCPMWVCCQL